MLSCHDRRPTQLAAIEISMYQSLSRESPSIGRSFRTVEPMALQTRRLPDHQRHGLLLPLPIPQLVEFPKAHLLIQPQARDTGLDPDRHPLGLGLL
jgi:hypothetical protein